MHLPRVHASAQKLMPTSAAQAHMNSRELLASFQPDRRIKLKLRKKSLEHFWFNHSLEKST
jgi:hypothetical protein